MMRSFWSKVHWGALVASAFIAGGCAEEREPINRVQANALDKSFFVGKNLQDPADDPEFYSAATVVDVPYGVNHGIFSGMAGGLKRLKWEISEEKLLARATYETYDGIDGRGSKRTNNGQVIAAFPITAHFDIKRSYNPSTGEELNVIEENTSDRPWNERQYFRVDWSTNLLTSSIWWDPMAQNTMFGDSGYTTEPLAYYVNDPHNPDAPVFATSEGYFDVTQKVFVTPMTLTVDGMTAPTCLWYGRFVTGGTAETGVCESSEIKLRMSFLKLKSPGDSGYQEYEPRHWDGARMDAFGMFTVDRKGYDNHFGVIDDKWYRFAQRYNIWAESFAKNQDGSLIACATNYADGADPNRDNDGDGTDDECASAGAGSVCNTIARACTIPYAKRQVKTVAWHHHMMDDDEVVVDWSERATEEWDTALRMAVQAARQAECRRTGGASVAGTPFEGKGDCESTFPVDLGEEVELRNVRALNTCWAEKGRRSPECTAPSAVAAIEPVIAFCHNPVRATDDAACGKPGLVTRVGDIRYHSINMWRTPENSSPWGFGPSWADPLTGEIIQSSINVYNSVTDRQAQAVIDKARWYAGELTSDQVTSGDYVRGWVNAKASPLAGEGVLMSPEEVEHRVKSLSHATEATTDLLQQPTGTFTRPAPNIGIDVLRKQLLDNKAPPVVGGANRAEFESRIDSIKGTPIEAELVGPMWVEAAGIDPNTPATADVLDVASPLRALGFRNLLNFQEAVHRRLAKQGMCLYDNEAVEPSSVIAISKLLNRKFGAYDAGASPGAQNDRIQKMWDYVRGKMHYGVLLHEMGHTIGERHNFTSSYDKFNYRPQYWQLRTGDSATKQRVTQRCTSPSTDPTGENCIGPRYYDPMTPAEIDNSIYTWAQTTVMDYSGELTHDWLGLGAYDYAAARMFYGDVVDVRPDLAFTCDADESHVCQAESVPAEQALGLVDFPGYLISQTVDVSNRTLHYSEWNDFFPLVAGCRAASSQELDAPGWWDADRYGAWDPVFDAEVINNEVCQRPATKFYQWRELRPDTLRDFTLNDDPQYFTPRRPVTRPDGAGRSFLRVPYSFASDDWVDGWSPSTQTRDAGADVYEETLWYLHQYENGHIWRNFRNNRTGFSIVGAYQGDLTRNHTKLANFAQGLSILHDYYFNEIAKNAGFTHADIVGAYEGDGGPMRDSAVAASVVFDHFLRVLTRPQTGQHRMFGGNMFMSTADRIGTSDPLSFETVINIPNGTSLAGNDITFGGRPLDSGYEYGKGYWAYDYVNQCGSYYEKTYVFDMLLNAYYRAPAAFSRYDGIDGRWRHTNFGNLFPDGIRRLIGAFLTEDWELFAPRVTATAGAPDLDQSGYPSKPLGWVSYVPAAGPEYCFPSAGNYVCTDTMSTPILPNSPESVALEPQVGYETQKFMAFWAYVYQPGSEVMDFTDMMRLWKSGISVNPYLAGYIQWTDPESGSSYFAKRYGDETILGKTYDKGIAAKMLQWANKLSGEAYVLDPTTPYDAVTGSAQYVRDANGNAIVAATATTAQGGPCSENPKCVQLRKYRGLMDFMTEVAHWFGYDPPELPFN